MKPAITAELARELFDYDAETGRFTWRTGARAGRVVGTVDSSGYLCVNVRGKFMRLHRLAWLISSGAWPEKLIDHIDGDRLNNRFTNLREVNSSGNQQNRATPNRNRSSGGPLGAHLHRQTGKWVAQIMVSGKRRCLGYFETAEQAGAAYQQAKAELHPFSSRSAA